MIKNKIKIKCMYFENNVYFENRIGPNREHCSTPGLTLHGKFNYNYIVIG